MSKLARWSGVALAVVIPFVATATPAHAANMGQGISRGETLRKGDYLHKEFSGYAVELIMQNDGNLVLKATNGHVCWAAGTNPGGSRAVYQKDGNFVIYNSSGRALWASNTVGETWETGTSVNIGVRGGLYAGYKKVSGDCSWR
ncbi:hypothetical protein [Streptomyces bluensis]|uniref:hypothetical protein n=1 Tax=Streptomyces bluensis TaxID=33897 RepID=UPI001679E4A5|nr:hypothetical protein [Streptomyces bluensis]GGZ80040.1 hypothetical protein GCM10010344_53950 [Streptomyces bluensis]